MRHFPNNLGLIRRGIDRRAGLGPLIDIGLNTFTGHGVTLSRHDFMHHLLIAGATGTGKSMLLEHLCRRLVVQRSLSVRNGGLIVFDPHWIFAGGLIDFMALANLNVPLLVIDFEGDDVVAFDPLRDADPSRLDVLGGWIAHLWERQGNSRAPRLSAGIVRVARAIVEANATLAEAHDLLDPVGGDRRVRQGLIDRIADASLASQWRADLKASDRYFELLMGSTQRAFAPLIDTLPKRWACGLGASLRFEEALAEGWVVLVSAGRTSGHLAQATLMLDALWHAAVNRPQGSPPMHLVIDEFAQLLSPAVVPLLPEARKFGLSVTLATQSPTDLSAMGPAGRQVLNAILHSARTKIAFQLAGDGARALASHLSVEPGEVQQLPRRHAVVSSMSHRQPQRFITDDVPDFRTPPARRGAYLSNRMSRWRGQFVFSRQEARQRYLARRAQLAPQAAAVVAADEPDEFEVIIPRSQS